MIYQCLSIFFDFSARFLCYQSLINCCPNWETNYQKLIKTWSGQFFLSIFDQCFLNLGKNWSKIDSTIIAFATKIPPVATLVKKNWFYQFLSILFLIFLLPTVDQILPKLIKNWSTIDKKLVRTNLFYQFLINVFSIFGQTLIKNW